MPDEVTKFDKIQLSMFDQDALAKLTAKELELRTRYMTVFTIWLENYEWSDQDIVRYMRTELNLNKSQAYIDLQKIKMMLGNVRNAAKEWHRYTVIEMCKTAYALAKKQNDIKSMVLAADKLGKYTKLDKDEIESMPWEKVQLPEIEATTDLSVLNISREDKFKKRVDALKKRYLGEDITVEEADVIN